MYAGITTLSVEREGDDDILLGMHSKEGESVNFEKTVNVTEDPRINIWLTKVDQAMTTSLASLLERSLKEITVIEAGKEEDLIKIIEKYPAQVILLGLQTLWCSKIESAFETQKL